VNALLLLAAQNTLVALLLAFLVYGLTRVWRIPPLAHLLWLLVLLKLVAPPRSDCSSAYATQASLVSYSPPHWAGPSGASLRVRRTTPPAPCPYT